MESRLARTTTYAAHLLDGNPITDLLSIGSKTPKTGPDPPAPAIVGGLNNHGTFEGDASMTRADAFFGDNHSFNPALFEEVSAFFNPHDYPLSY
jgi:unspecific peroxygenase